MALVLSVIVPAAGFAGPENTPALVPGDLISDAQAQPDKIFRVIVQGDQRTGRSDDVANVARNEGGNPKRLFTSLVGASVEVSGKDLLKLARHPHVSAITRDEQLSLVGNGDWDVQVPKDAEMWRDSINARPLWGSLLSPAPQAPAIAIVDTGIDATKVADFGTRIVARANFSSLEPNALGDPSGHGTMVAGVAAGNSDIVPGVARNARLVDVRVASSKGEALTSDIVAAVDWILANKSTYNIRVANFSLVGTNAVSFRFDPLDKAVEKLWLNGVVVVAAAGNNGDPTKPVGIGAPANDPFVISVGALDQAQTSSVSDDTRASWSAYGPTADGFMKPDVSAPGRYMVMPVPMNSALPLEKPNRVVKLGYMWMSGTSFSAPVVAGAAAQILARNPGFTADQVKGALMLKARYLASADPGAGVGEIDAASSASVSSPPNPNQNLYQFVVNGTFDAEAWMSHVTASANWTQSNWTSANWTSANWVSSNWVSSNWVSSNWVSSNWVSSNWVSSNWTVGTDAE
ncbi:MAG TPA: S8 family serine peptidase [Gaiellaceae bacterium]|nr:S8 family serine peptidase [Gaiellaceae bacterium]